MRPMCYGLLYEGKLLEKISYNFKKSQKVKKVSYTFFLSDLLLVCIHYCMIIADNDYNRRSSQSLIKTFTKAVTSN